MSTVSDKVMRDQGFEGYIDHMTAYDNTTAYEKKGVGWGTFLKHPFDRTKKTGLQRCWACKQVRVGNKKFNGRTFGFWRNNYTPPQYHYLCRQCFDNRTETNKKKLK